MGCKFSIMCALLHAVVPELNDFCRVSFYFSSWYIDLFWKVVTNKKLQSNVHWYLTLNITQVCTSFLSDVLQCKQQDDINFLFSFISQCDMFLPPIIRLCHSLLPLPLIAQWLSTVAADKNCFNFCQTLVCTILMHLDQN